MTFTPFNDCIAACLCGCCLIHQNVREIAERNGKEPVYMLLPGNDTDKEKQFDDITR